MKKIVLAVFILTLCASANPNPADYPLAVHVSSSRLSEHIGVFVETTINGTKYTLEDYKSGSPLLMPGDYKAKIVKSERKNSYQLIYTQYELLYPDGKTERFYVSGVSE